jgi:hypothetical protein
MHRLPTKGEIMLTKIETEAAVARIKVLRRAHDANLELLLDPSMRLFHERNGSYEDGTSPQIALARETILQLDDLLAAFEGQIAGKAVAPEHSF